MKLLRQYQMLSFVLVFLSIVGLCIAQQTMGLLLVAGALTAISWTITEGPRGRRLPRWAANILVLGVTLHALVDYVQGSTEVLRILGTFALWLTIIKLYERRTPRDHAHLLFLSLLVILVGCLHSTDLLFGVVLLLYAGLGVYVVLLYQLYAAYERERAVRAGSIPAGYRLAPQFKPIVGRRVGFHFRSLVSSVGLVGLALSALAFLLFPRGVGEATLMPFPDARTTMRPGFTGEVDLTRGGRITDSRRVVMHVQLRDSNDQPIRESVPVRLRGAVLDAYKGHGRWERQERLGRGESFDHRRFTNFLPQMPVDGRTITQDFHTIHENQVLFSMYAPFAVRAEQSFRGRFDSEHLAIAMERDSRAPSRYSVLAHPVPTDDMLEELSSPRLARYAYERLENEEIRALAHALLENTGIPIEPPHESPERWQWNRQAAGAFLQYLHSPEFEYTIDLSDVTLPVEGGRMMDPNLFFLTELKRGHCEYFASAFVALCHNVGIEARLVTGYVAQTYDERRQHYAVMERNAHAWAEVRTGELRWATFDPTRPSVLEQFHYGETGFADQMRWLYDRFDGLWSRAIVTYDAHTQTELAGAWDDEAFFAWLRAWGDRIRTWLDRVNRAFALGPAGYIYVVFLSALLVFFVTVLIGMLRRMVKIRRVLHLEHLRGRAYRRMLHQLGFYLDMLRILRRAGFDKPHWRPPMDHARHVAQDRPEAAEPVRTVTELFYEARYGDRELRGDDRRRIDQALDDLAAVLGVRRGAWLTR